MKKKCLLFIFIFLGIVLFKIDGVRADKITIIYNQCNNISDRKQEIDIGGSTYECNDSDFDNWIVEHIENKSSEIEYVCTNGRVGSECSYPNYYATFTNGFNSNLLPVREGDVVYLQAEKDGSIIDPEVTPSEGKTLEDKAKEDLNARVEEAIKNSKVCTDYKTDTECKRNKCSWNKEYGFCSNDGLTYLKCGDANDFPSIVPKLSSYAVTLLKTVTPVVLIIFSIISLVKAMTSSKEEDIKKAQAGLIKRIIISALIFFVITIVQFIMLKVASSAEKDNLSSCLSCLLNGTSDCGSIYYKSGSGKCFYVKGGEYDCD